MQQERRQPVIARVALGGDAQQAGAIARHLADVVLGALEALEDVASRRQEPFARGREHEALADAQKQRRPEPRFDVAQLVAERRLREMQPIARAREAADVGDRGDELQVADLEIHAHEATSSS